MIFVLRGTSCSGKDYFAERHFAAHTILSSDGFRKMLFDRVEEQANNRIVFDTLNSILEQRLRFGVAYTVVNATSLKFKDCATYFELAKKFGVAITVISIDPPGTDVLLARNESRGAAGGLKVPEEVIHRHLNSYYTGMERFVDAQKEFDNYTFIRINQQWEIVQ